MSHFFVFRSLNSLNRPKALKSLAMAFICLLLAPSAHATGPLKLGLNWKPEPQFGGFYAAQTGKLFEKNGLQVQILPGGSGTPTIQMLGSGQLDYAIVSADEIIMAHDRGNSDVVAIFASFQTNPQCILVREDAPVASLSDLFQNSDFTLLWQEGLPYAMHMKKKYGPIKVKTAPYTGGISGILSNPKVAQQGFATSEPLLTKAAHLATKTFLVAESGYNPYTTVLATTRKRIQSNQKEISQMLEAVRSGWLDYLNGPDKTNQLMNQLNPSMDIATMKDSATSQRILIQNSDTGSKGVGKMTEARWSELARQLKELGVIKGTPNVKNLYWVK